MRTCVMRSDKRELQLFERSEKHWEQEKEKDPSYSVEQHKDWCDEFNEGDTHFGVHPDLLKRSSIQYDTFHATKSCAVQIMDKDRYVLTKYSGELNTEFEKLLKDLNWSNFTVKIWMNDKSFSIYDGNTIKKLYEFFDNKLSSNTHVDTVK